MKRTLLAVALITFVTPLLAQTPDRVRLIVRGDDMGMARAVNLATIESYRNGIVRSAEVMVPCPWFLEAAELLRQHPGLDAGIHLVMTSEWDRLKWRPLTFAPSLVDSNGYFFPRVWFNENTPQDVALLGHPWKLDEIERELRAQIELAKRHIPQLSHVSDHMGFSNMDPRVNALVKRLAREYELDIDLAEMGVAGANGYDGPRGTPEEKVTTFIDMLEGLKPGTYLYLEHPGYDNQELQGTGHTGYENVGADREGITRMFTDPRVAAAIKRLNIEVLSYRDAQQLKRNGPKP